MKKLFALVAVGLLILGAASCDTKNIGNLVPNANPTIDNVAYVQATGVLTVTASDANNDTVTVTVTEPAGLEVDATSKVAAATGTATFNWTATVPADGGTGTTTITASDGHGGTATMTQIIVVDPVTTGNAPVIGAVTFDGATGVLTVPVTDADNDNVTVTVTDVAGLTVDTNTATVNGGAGNAVFTWTGTGTGDTTITASDPGGLTDTATQTITMGGANMAPVIGAVTFDGATGVLTVPITDADGDNVTVTVTDVAGLTVDTNTATVNGGAGNAVFTWTGVGTGDTTITADDGNGGTDTATQTITMAGGNAAPVIGAVAFDGATGVLTVPVTDADGDNVTVSVTNVAGLTVDTNTATVNGGAGNAVFTWTGVGTGDTTITADDGNGGTDTATQTITLTATNNAPEIGAVTYAGGVLTVPVTDVDGDAIAVTVTVPAGLAVDNTTVNIAAGGSAVFNWSAVDILAGGTGDTTITADDGNGGTDTATQTITIAAAGPFADDNLYAYPASNTVAAGSPLTVYVITGDPAHDLQFLSSVGFTVETGGTYVASSFNLGVPGGARMDSDGYWALMGPPAPTATQYLDLGDAFMPGTPVDIGGGLHRYTFAVVTMGPFTAPAAVPGGAVLFTFQLTFAAAGNYNLGFQLEDASTPPIPQTYYADAGGTNYNWATLNGAAITVN